MESVKVDEMTLDEAVRGSSNRVDEKRIEKAVETLSKYKEGKVNLDSRIIENEDYYRMKTQGDEKSKTKSAWLFNSLANKHADAMDNFPEAIVLPRELSDKKAAETLTSILPVQFERSNFSKVYSDAWWEKLKSGTAVYGVFWNSQKLGGLGDIDITNVDLLNLYFEPGIKDIQDSENVFYLKLANNDALIAQYPQLKDKLGGSNIEVQKYAYDDTVDTSNKTVVVDWYYKKHNSEGKEVLHYCKFCNGVVLYASENESETSETGFYEHGKYPFVFSVLYPTQGSPCGFGFIDLMKETQDSIENLDAAILKNTKLSSEPRFFINSSGAVNEEEFADWESNFVHVNGSNLGEDSIRPITVPNLNTQAITVRDKKIEELKETSGNRDFSQGATASGVTAASAIAALQEAGGKLSRDMIKQDYDSFKILSELVIENIRQFFDNERTYRIVGPNEDEEQFVVFDNSHLKEQQQSKIAGVDVGPRVPVFDLNVKISHNTSYSKLSQNELALQFFNAGFFNPGNSDMALATIGMMDFEGKQAVVNKITENGTMHQKLAQLIPITIKCAAIVDQMKPGLDLSGQVASIVGSASAMSGGGAVSSVQVDNSLEAQARRRSNDSTKPI